MTLNEKRMEKLNRLYTKCRKNMERIGIDVGNVIQLDVLGKSDRVAGRCGEGEGGFIIRISNIYLDDCPDEISECVVYHELIHTVPGCYNHSDKFMSLAKKIQTEYHTINDLYFGTAPADNGYIIKKAKWAYRCGSCGWMQVRTGTVGPKTKSSYQCPLCAHGSLLRPITGDAFEKLKEETNKKYFKEHPINN